MYAIILHIYMYMAKYWFQALEIRMHHHAISYNDVRMYMPVCLATIVASVYNVLYIYVQTAWEAHRYLLHHHALYMYRMCIQCMH